MADKPAKPQQRRTPAQKPSPNKAGIKRPSPSNAQSANKTNGPKKQAGSVKPKRTGTEDVPMIYGAEALAAVTVAESKLSRFKGRALLGLLVLCAALIVWNAALQASQPEPKLLGMTVDGRIQELPLLDKPLESRQLLMDWVRRNIPDLYDWNYANYRSELNKARNYTQQVTLEKFQTDLGSSGILKKVLDDFLILRANIVDEPVVVNETITKGRRLWIVEIPMTLVYDSGEVKDGQRRRINQDILFTAWIVRANILEYDAGLMLAKYAVQPRR